MPFVVTTNGTYSGQQLSESLQPGVNPLSVLPTERLRELYAELSRPDSTQAFAEKYRHFRHPTPWFHTAWYAAMDNPDWDHIYIQGPREHAKTSTVLTYVERRLAQHAPLRVGIISGTDDLAKKFLNEVKYELEANEQLIADYAVGKRPGNRFVGPKWTEHELVLSGAREAGMAGKDVSLFSVGRGAQISSRHCDLLVVDDIESAESVKSDIVRQAMREYWAREVAPVLSPGGKFIVTGTRKHFDDLYAALIRDEAWHVIDAAKSVFLDDGAPIWPDMWDINGLLARKKQLDATDLLAWSQEYLNEPRPSETQMFYPEKWPTYAKTPKELSYFQSWDLAISEKEYADYTVGFTIGVDEDNNVYVLERRKGHWDFNRQLSEIGDMGNRWAAGGQLAAIGIESVAYQAAAVQEALRRTMLPIVPVTPQQADGLHKAGAKDKVSRARLLEARAGAGKVYRPIHIDEDGKQRDPEWWSDFVTEATFFPAGAHDDQIDALNQAVKLAGAQVSAINWAYGVWKCPKCAHLYMWEAGRVCPKCGNPAAESYENPELAAYGVGA